MDTEPHDTTVIFTSSVRRRGEWAAVLLSGEVDGDSCERLGPLIDDLVDGQGLLDVEIDLREVRFLDSQGIRLLVVTDRTLRERGGRLCLVDVPPPVQRVLQIVGLADHFAMRDAIGGCGGADSSCN